MAGFIPDLSAARLPPSARSAWESLNGAREPGDGVPPYLAFQERFAASVRDYPGRPAVADESGMLTYAQLDRISGCLAARLRPAARGRAP